MAQIDKPNLHFNTVLYTGDGATSTAGTLARTISGVGFQPDFTWVKGRTSGGYDSHGLHDAVRTAPKWLRSDGTDQEYDVRTGFGSGGIGSFTSDGFGIFSGTTGATTNYNTSSTTYVAWNWKANGQGSANTTGTINTTYTSANTTAGFSICTWTGTGTAGTIGHGLSAVPKMIIIKRLDGADNWWVYHVSNSEANSSNDAYLELNAQNAASTSGGSGIFNSTAPTSSVFSIGTNGGVNASGGTYVAYVFAEKKGFSKFNRYEGNSNAFGTFVYTGFKPAFLIVKPIDASDNWVLFDNKREGYNVDNDFLYANSTAAENDADIIDLLSNGFKMRNSGNTNNRSSTFVYWAIAENPLVGSNGIPAVAR